MKIKNDALCGIRTHASEDITTWTWRVRPTPPRVLWKTIIILKSKKPLLFLGISYSMFFTVYDFASTSKFFHFKWFMRYFLNFFKQKKTFRHQSSKNTSFFFSINHFQPFPFHLHFILKKLCSHFGNPITSFFFSRNDLCFCIQ